MGKRTNYKKIERDFYPTPCEAVVPLLYHLPEKLLFDEPCAGNGMLLDHLEAAGHRCLQATDIKPQRDDVGMYDVFDIKSAYGDCFITNPPWSWQILNPLISQLSNITGTWLLLNADLMHNKRMSEHMKKCIKIVSVGRVSWMQNNQSGFENCAWFLFDQRNTKETIFIGRQKI